MDIREVKVETPLGVANGIKINDTKDIVVVAVLRAAIPMVEGIMNVFDEAQYGWSVLGVRRNLHSKLK